MPTRLLLFTGIAALVFPGFVRSGVSLREAFPNLGFTRPVDLQNAGDGTGRLFVVEQEGLIRVFPNDQSVSEAGVFLDIRDRVDDSGNEEGLLGLVFHPDYEENGYFYVDYTTSGTEPTRTRISRFSVSETDSSAADPGSELVILEFGQPFSNHNAGQLAFGPEDGYLYITAGDGGSAGDPQGNGQNRATLLGSILRIDVDSTSQGRNYTIPPDNPFVGNEEGYREEIFAYGLRNPWRISFDPESGWLWAGDVGQNAWEEIDVIEKGRNYGWNVMEGFHCYSPPEDCDTAGLALPVWEYGHNVGSAITGGHVYHGSAVPELAGLYVYADFGSGRIWTLRWNGSGEPENTEIIDSPLNIPTFGVDESGELYLAAFDGKIYGFEQGTTDTGDDSPAVAPAGFGLDQNFPNPFNPSTTIPFTVPDSPGEMPRVRLAVFGVRGRLVRTLVDGPLAAGRHRVVWDGCNQRGEQAGSGIYLASISCDGQTRTRKLILLE
jgi:glucose/arabinose dehydrogenase